jgi:hypothetical protein
MNTSNDIKIESIRDEINSLLDMATSCPSITPYIAFEKARKILSVYHIHPPGGSYMEGEYGSVSFPAEQYGEKTGMDPEGKIVTTNPSDYIIYFEWSENDQGTFDIFTEILDKNEFEEIKKDKEDELD